jgi:hypothetical protein
VTRLTSPIAPLLYRHFIKQGRLYMRKLILISAFVLASVSQQAVEARELILAASDAAATAAAPAPATPAPATAATATPAAPAATADTAPPQASRKQISRPQTLGRRETNEQKARVIAARYGISW